MLNSLNLFEQNLQIKTHNLFIHSQINHFLINKNLNHYFNFSKLIY